MCFVLRRPLPRRTEITEKATLHNTQKFCSCHTSPISWCKVVTCIKPSQNQESDAVKHFSIFSIPSVTFRAHPLRCSFTACSTSQGCRILLIFTTSLPVSVGVGIAIQCYTDHHAHVCWLAWTVGLHTVVTLS